MKKVTALFLAMLLCMALSVSVLGVSDISGDLSANQTENANPTALQYNTILEEPTISVTVPAAAQTLLLNPYNILVAEGVGNASGDTTFGGLLSGDSNGSILASKLYLVNKSNVPLNMTLTLNGQVPSGSKAAFNTTKVPDTEKNKKIFLFVDVGEASSIKTGASSFTPPQALSTLKADDYKTTNKWQGVVKVGDLKMVDVLKIPAAKSGEMNYATIQVGGNCTPTPTEKWGATDTVTLKLVFTFQATNNSTT